MAQKLEKKARSFCFTDYELDEKFYDKNKLKWDYIILGDEICPTTNKRHWQGFIRFKNARSWNSVQKLLNPRNFRICNGSDYDNYKYCSKDGNLILEDGNRPKQGERKDLHDFANAVTNGKITVDEIAIENPTMVHQYGRTLDRLEDIYLRTKKRTWMTTCEYIYGPTGVGKSHYAFTNYPDAYVYPNDNGWWDGYKGQKYVIINEFRGQITLHELLELIDKWPKTVRRRGREPVPFLAEHIVITSCKHYKEIYKNVEERLEQLDRRVTVKKLTVAQKCSEGNTTTSVPSPSE